MGLQVAESSFHFVRQFARLIPVRSLLQRFPTAAKERRLSATSTSTISQRAS
jgi:hypothetical protein